MEPPAWPANEAEVEAQILTLLRRYRRLTFRALADAFPDCRWRELLSILNRLWEREQIDLLALQWDYEVSLRNAEKPC